MGAPSVSAVCSNSSVARKAPRPASITVRLPEFKISAARRRSSSQGRRALSAASVRNMVRNIAFAAAISLTLHFELLEIHWNTEMRDAHDRRAQCGKPARRYSPCARLPCSARYRRTHP